METVTFRQSTSALGIKLAIDVVLCMIFFLGVPIAILQLLEFMRNSVKLGEKSAVLSLGVFSTTVTEVPYAKINSVSITQSVLGKALNYGTVVINTGNDVTGFKFKAIQDPSKLKALLQSKQG
jgi:uncharacterized membrane protein YdbT with pleckstrin-like domain